MLTEEKCSNCFYNNLFSDEDPCNKCMTPFGKRTKWKPNIGKFWEKITDIYLQQKKKGLANYGQTLEENKTPDLNERLRMLQEEMVDALMYIEWIKEKIGGD